MCYITCFWLSDSNEQQLKETKKELTNTVKISFTTLHITFIIHHWPTILLDIGCPVSQATT